MRVILTKNIGLLHGTGKFPKTGQEINVPTGRILTRAVGRRDIPERSTFQVVLAERGGYRHGIAAPQPGRTHPAAPIRVRVVNNTTKI